MTDPRILSREAIRDIQEEIKQRDAVALEIKDFAKRMAHYAVAGNYGEVNDAYLDLIDGLEDLASDFAGSAGFKRLERELQDHDEAVGAAEEAAERRSYLAKVT